MISFRFLFVYNLDGWYERLVRLEREIRFIDAVVRQSSLGGGQFTLCRIKGHKYNGKLENLQVLDSRNTWTSTRIFSGTPCLQQEVQGFQGPTGRRCRSKNESLPSDSRFEEGRVVARKKHLRLLSLGWSKRFSQRYATRNRKRFNDTYA